MVSKKKKPRTGKKTSAEPINKYKKFYKDGELVSVKMRGYCWWPAEVLHMKAPDKYEVLFFGKNRSTFIAQNKKDILKPYTEMTKAEKEKWKTSRNLLDLKLAVEQIEKVIKEKGSHESPEDENVASDEDEPEPEPAEPVADDAPSPEVIKKAEPPRLVSSSDKDEPPADASPDNASHHDVTSTSDLKSHDIPIPKEVSTKILERLAIKDEEKEAKKKMKKQRKIEEKKLRKQCEKRIKNLTTQFKERRLELLASLPDIAPNLKRYKRVADKVESLIDEFLKVAKPEYLRLLQPNVNQETLTAIVDLMKTFVLGKQYTLSVDIQEYCRQKIKILKNSKIRDRINILKMNTTNTESNSAGAMSEIKTNQNGT